MCRLVYELSQTNYGDTHSFQSLDDTYFVAGQPLGHGRATRDHIPLRQKEIGVKQGDAVQFLGNHWDGYALAVGMKKKKSGLLPAFKIDRIYIMYNWSSKIKT